LPPVHTKLWQSVPVKQFLFVVHVGHVPPPQSMSVSTPFFTVSAHVAAAHSFSVQTLLTQSPATLQTPFVPQRVQLVEPPQSTSLSPPFLTLSLQAAARHTPVVHTLLIQSVAAAQVPLVPHRIHVVDPPQSMSLSAPFLTTSLQVGAAHIPPEHTPLWQSTPLVQPLEVAHLVVQLPPQSRSVSVPFLTPSPQVGARHRNVVGEQTPLWQSALPAQERFVPHLAQSAPPQSTSVSEPFGAWSLQEAD
jgi:hypothetical protein